MKHSVTLSKKEIACRLGLVHPGGVIRYKVLNDRYLKPLLVPHKLTENELKQIRVFDAVISAYIVDNLGI